MYKSNGIGFRPIEEGDLETLRELRNDMSTFLQLGTVDMASAQGQRSWWNNNTYTAKDQRLTLTELGSGEVIGILRIQNIDQSNCNCEVGLDILPARRGKGLAKASYKCVLEYLFLQKNMNMVYVKVADFNPQASRLYEALGFAATGFFKDYLYRHGRYWNYNIMCITRDVYREKSK